MARKSVRSANSVCSATPRSLTYTLIIVFVVAAAGYFAYRFAMSVRSSPSKNLDAYLNTPWSEHFSGSKNASHSCEKTDKPYSLLFFYMETCPHCIEMQPVWADLRKQLPDSPFATTLCLAEISAEQDSLIEKYGVQSFPTIILVKNIANDTFTPVEYDGPRTVADLREFLSRNIV